MNVNVEKLSAAKVKLEIVVEKERFPEALEAAYKKVAPSVEIKGFRKGKVPMDFYLKRNGEESLYEEAINYLVNVSYPQAVVESKLEVVSDPEFDVDFESIGSGKDFKYSVTVEIWPEVTLGEYKGLKVEKESAEVTSAEVDKYINEVLNSKAELQVVENESLQEGHTAIIDFEGFLNGEAFEGGKAENHSLEIGSGSFIPGFEEQLVGMNVGEEKTINTKFPDDYHAENLKGQTTEFKVKLHEIKNRVVPTLTDEIVKDLDVEGVSTAEEYRQNILEKLQSEKATMVENTFIDALVTKACENAETEVPHSLVHEEIDQMVSQVEQQAKQYGMTADQLLSFNGITLDQYKQQLHEPSEKRVLERIVLRKIAEVENFEITEEDYNKQYEEIAAMYKKSVDEVKKLIAKEQLQAHINILKAIDLIKQTANQ